MNFLNPEVQILYSSQFELIFRLKNCDVSYVNNLRQYIMAETSSLAFDYIEIVENSTALPDEQIAHRIGMIPLYTKDPLKYIDSSACDCLDYCNKCSVAFELDSNKFQFEDSFEDKGNERSHENTSGIRTVTSKELKLSSINENFETNTENEEFQNSTKKSFQGENFDININSNNENENEVKIGIEENSSIPIVKIKSGQRIAFKTLAKVKRGIEHVKFSPVNICSYHIDRDISIDPNELEKLEEEKLREFLNGCPIKCKNVRDFVKSKNLENVYNSLNSNENGKDEENKMNFRGGDKKIEFYKYCPYCHRNANEIGISQILVIGNESDEFVFGIEGSGSVDVRMILKIALRRIEEETGEVEAAIEDFLN